MTTRRKPKSTVTELRAPPASRMRSGRARVLRAAAFATAGLGTVGLLLTGVLALAAGASTQLPWASGVYMPSETPASVTAFAAWRGAPVNVATVWPIGSSWNDITNPVWLYRIWQASPYTLVVTVPMLPTAVSGVSIQACATAPTTRTGGSSAR